MKKQVLAVMLVLTVLLYLTACAAADAVEVLDIVEDKAEARLEAVLIQPEETLGNIPEPAAAEPVIPAQTQPSGRLTAQQAEQVALDYLGFTADQVTGLRTKYEFDDGIGQYDIVFFQDDWKYDFDIHAESGKILSYDAESAAPAPAPTAPAQTQPSGRLTAQQAEQVALDYLGFTADQVTGLRTEFDVDDGIAQYDIEFYQGDWEYEFEIYAENGKILSYDKDHKYD